MRKFEYTLTDFHATEAKRLGTVADLILDAHFIPSCGLIPPFRVVASLIRVGNSGGGMGPGCIWESFDLAEPEYWEAVAHLEKLTTADLSGRTPIMRFSGEIRPDYSAPETDDYIAWLDSLIVRGHLQNNQPPKRKR